MSTAVTNRQTFRKNERLCSQKILDELVKKGKYIHSNPFRLTWLTTTLPENVWAQIAFAVPARNFKNASDRNRIKRRMREAYRKNKSALYTLISKTDLKLALLFVYTGKDDVTYSETETKTKQILSTLAENIKKFTS